MQQDMKKSRQKYVGILARLIGIEPTHPAPEAGALSTELQAHFNYFYIIAQNHKKANVFCQCRKKRNKEFQTFLKKGVDI